MIISSLLFVLVTMIFLFHFKYNRQKSWLRPSLVSICLSVLSVSIWFVVITPQDSAKTVVKLDTPMTIEEILEEIQGKLREDRNNPDLWFQLGQGYFANGEFENANTCFEYVIRLMDEPSSTVYAAKATALYYVSSQRITQEVNQLLELSLSKDQLNDTALTLIANDHFISFRYEEAIATWQRILDSERANIDRVAIINSINRAKALSH